MHKVTVNGKIHYAPHGTVLSDVLHSSGNNVPHPCAGKGICKKCTVTVNGSQVLACQYTVSSDITVSICNEEEHFTSADTASDSADYCLALDIGTTTLALALISPEEKRIINTVTCTNPQCSYGADVISRIEYCSKHGTAALRDILVAKINGMILGMGIKNAHALYVAGNTTMLHILTGSDCESLGVAPYTPVFLERKTVNAHTLGINGVKIVEILPSVSAFVGADIVAGMNFISLPTENMYNMLVDLGTNAEIVLFSKKDILCTSAAAGPCLEGAKISCGMSACDGAIYSYNGNTAKTIGNTEPKGICGTGLIDIIAQLLSSSVIDETGFMECEKFSVTSKVSLTQADVREFQLAKSAIYSAILTLIKKQNISFEQIETVYISGGFSHGINTESAVKTGLIPSQLKEKCICISNSSLLGTVKYAIEKNDLSVFTDNAVYADLSSDSHFSELFIKNMMFSQ